MEKKTFQGIAHVAIQQLQAKGAKFIVVLMADDEHHGMAGVGKTTNTIMVEVMADFLATTLKAVEQQEGKEVAAMFVDQLQAAVQQRMDGQPVCHNCAAACNDDDELLAMPTASQAIN